MKGWFIICASEDSFSRLPWWHRALADRKPLEPRGTFRDHCRSQFYFLGLLSSLEFQLLRILHQNNPSYWPQPKPCHRHTQTHTHKTFSSMNGYTSIYLKKWIRSCLYHAWLSSIHRNQILDVIRFGLFVARKFKTNHLRLNDIIIFTTQLAQDGLPGHLKVVSSILMLPTMKNRRNCGGHANPIACDAGAWEALARLHTSSHFSSSLNRGCDNLAPP